MSWRVKLKDVVEDSTEFDHVRIDVEYFNLLGRESFQESFSFSVEDSWETIKTTVLKKLGVLNFFRGRVDGLKIYIGRYISDIPSTEGWATSLGLTFGKSIPKEITDQMAKSLGLTFGSPVLKDISKAETLEVKFEKAVPK